MTINFKNNRIQIIPGAALIISILVIINSVSASTQTLNESKSVGLTIYSSADPGDFNPQKFISQQHSGYTPKFVRGVPGFGVVRQTCNLDIEKGVNIVNFTNVARFIDPTTVNFTNLDGADTDALRVLKQTFLFDLVNPDKLLENYLDRKINITRDHKTFNGILLSYVGGKLILQKKDGSLELIPQSGAQVSLDKLPGGLITKPTLQWKISAAKAGNKNIRTSYQTDGITWRADYNLVLNQDDTKADLSAWVSILNLTGKSYKDATLKLIAGDVHRVKSRPAPRQYLTMNRAVAEVKNNGFKEKSFYTYHMYTLPRPATINNNTVQQLSLFPNAHNISVHKVLVYNGVPSSTGWSYAASPRKSRNFGNSSNHKVNVYLKFKNSKNNNLGMPLPAGKVRVYKKDSADDSSSNSSATLEFIGEDLIDHTPKDETLLIKTGKSFDIVGERKQVSFHVNTSKKTMTESFRIELRNHREKGEDVIIKENLYRWSNWSITEHSDGFKKINSRTIHFPVTVPADGKKVVTYTVKYTW